MKHYYRLNTEYMEHTVGESCLRSVDARCYREYQPKYGPRVFQSKIIKVYSGKRMSDSDVMAAILRGDIDLSLAKLR